jgi:hypothetical protein
MGCQGSKAIPATAPPKNTLLTASASPKSAHGTEELAVPPNSKELSIPTTAEFSTGKHNTQINHMKGQVAAHSHEQGTGEHNSQINHMMGQVATHSHEQGNHKMLRKQRTMATDRYELDVMVSQFTAHDSTVGSAVGRNCKHLQWKVMFDLDAPPIDIALHVQEHKLHSNEVKIDCNGQAIFHGAGSHAKAKMTEDFYYQWPFRAQIRGINEHNYFELCPSHLNSDVWLPATITSQRSDGFFAVTAQQVEANGCLRFVEYPAVHKADLRVASSRSPLEVPESTLMLHVPKQNPLHAVLSVDGDLITHHFGRPSPSPSITVAEKPQLKLQVSRDRKTVTTNVGHNVLSHFISGEVRSIKSDIQRLSHAWTVQLGPFAEHTVKIVKKHTLGKIITLMVDGDVFVECTASDIGCPGNEWQCEFSFVGERVIDFEVFKTNKDGVALDEIDHVVERRKYLHNCLVRVPNDWDFSSAQFFIDGIDFKNMIIMPQSQLQETTLSMDPMVLSQSYGISVPYKVDYMAPSGLAYLSNQLLVHAETGISQSKTVASGFFEWCRPSAKVPDTTSTKDSDSFFGHCYRPTVLKEEVISEEIEAAES